MQLLVFMVVGLGLLLWVWLARRGSTLTRLCRWRERRDLGPGQWRCEVCGGSCSVPAGRTPRHCGDGREGADR